MQKAHHLSVLFSQSKPNSIAKARRISTQVELRQPFTFWRTRFRNDNTKHAFIHVSENFFIKPE